MFRVMALNGARFSIENSGPRSHRFRRTRPSFSSVRSLAQTKDGYLWLATYEGVFRFDGIWSLSGRDRHVPCPDHTLLFY